MSFKKERDGDEFFEYPPIRIEQAHNTATGSYCEWAEEEEEKPGFNRDHLVKGIKLAGLVIIVIIEIIIVIIQGGPIIV